jgi:hypothetical protein
VTSADLDSSALWLMVALGAYHGINPGMGWLFAVALGLQRQQASAVAKSLAPIALGHALAMGTVVMAVAVLGAVLPFAAIRYSVAAILMGLGLYRLASHRHPRWVRMQVGFRDLTVWSFLMATAHGAGLMVVPTLLESSAVAAAHHVAGETHASTIGSVAGLLATTVHTFGYLLVTGTVAWVVYRKLGLALLRTAWFNLDLIWGAALIFTGLVTLVI